MENILKRLTSGEILISDGAMGSFLQELGLQSGECPEYWNITHPDVIRGIAEVYLKAGSDIVETNTFGANGFKLSAFGLEERVDELNEAAVRLAREAVGDGAYIFASVGPTGQILEEEGGSAAERDIYDAFKDQVEALADAGADVICIETMLSVKEAIRAIKAAKENTSLPIACSFTFEKGARGYRTLMGASPADAVNETAAAGADIVGSNCGNGIVGMIDVAKEIRAALPRKPIMIQANAGVPILEDGKTVFKDTPKYMAGLVPQLVAAGVNIIGGCCGTTPEHIHGIADAVRKT